MIRFREQVSGAKEQIHERGLLERALRRELGAMTPVNSEGESRVLRGTVEPRATGRYRISARDSQEGRRHEEDGRADRVGRFERLERVDRDQ